MFSVLHCTKERFISSIIDCLRCHLIQTKSLSARNGLETRGASSLGGKFASATHPQPHESSPANQARRADPATFRDTRALLELHVSVQRPTSKASRRTRALDRFCRGMKEL